MPLYEYQCQACGHRFEKIQKFSDAPLTSCPACGGVVDKLLSSPAIQFKGSGWYITDYARAGKGGDSAGGQKTDRTGDTAKTDASPGGGAAKTDAGTGTTTSESKPATPAAKPE
jgi:putative FmdB family regulatory protein